MYPFTFTYRPIGLSYATNKYIDLKTFDEPDTCYVINLFSKSYFIQNLPRMITIFKQKLRSFIWLN